ncbi:MAG: hypothetical protein ACE5HO_06695 [bacterium]
MHRILKITTILMMFLVAATAFAGGTIKGKIVYKKKRWVRNSLVYIETVKGNWKPTQAEIDQKGSTFIPKYLPVIKGSTVTFLNSDPTKHNVYSPDREKYDLGVTTQGGKLSYTFKKVGVYTQLCKLHPTMLAYVMVLQNPYYGMSDKTGAFTIEDVPPGKYKLLTWNERYKADPVEITVQEGKVSEVEIKLHR